jgi:hypothetical protein
MILLEIKALKARFISVCCDTPIVPMPQFLSKVILHIIFSIRDREPWLDRAIRPRMYAYLATICRDLGGDGIKTIDP